VAGPALAGLLGAMGLGELPVVIAAFAISGVAILIVAVGLPETTLCALSADPEPVNIRRVLGQQHKECFTMPAARTLTAAQILALPSMNLMLAVYFLVFLGFNLFYVAFPVYATTAIAWSLTRIGAYFAVMGLMMALAQGALLRRLSQRRWSDRNLVVAGSILLAASFPFFTATSGVLIYAGTALLAVGNGLMWPSLLALLSRATDHSVQGAVQGFASSTGAVASIVGLLLGGALYHSLGAQVFLLSAGLIALSTALALMIPGEAAGR
jgi:predicted MFS family arabinose efflux permease